MLLQTRNNKKKSYPQDENPCILPAEEKCVNKKLWKVSPTNHTRPGNKATAQEHEKVDAAGVKHS